MRWKVTYKPILAERGTTFEVVGYTLIQVLSRIPKKMPSGDRFYPPILGQPDSGFKGFP